MRPRATSGFTFIELLLAAAITAILLAGLTLHLRGGLLAWRRTITALEAMAHTRAQLERCAREVAQRGRCETSEITFRYGYAVQRDAPGIAWQPVWSDDARLPRLVELTLGAPARVRQVVVIPTGVLPPVER